MGGAHPSRFEDVKVAMHQSETHFARSMRTAAVGYREVVESPEILREEETKSLTQEVKAETRNTTATRREVLEW